MHGLTPPLQLHEILEAHLLDQARLGLQPVDMLFLILDDLAHDDHLRSRGASGFHRLRHNTGFDWLWSQSDANRALPKSLLIREFRVRTAHKRSVVGH